MTDKRIAKCLENCLEKNLQLKSNLIGQNYGSKKTTLRFYKCYCK